MRTLSPPFPDLRDPSLAGVCTVDAAFIPALAAAAREAGYAPREIMLHGAHDKAAVLSRIAQALEFPAWFGRNWDALADCLGDLEWLEPAAGHMLIIDGLASTLHLPLLDICEEASAQWREHGVPMWIAVVAEPLR